MIKRDPLQLLDQFEMPYLDKGGTEEWVNLECPFHNDKHDKLEDCHGRLKKDNGAFKCFSCGATGHVLSVIASKYGIAEKFIEMQADNVFGTAKQGFIEPGLVELCHKELLGSTEIKARMAKQHGILESDIVRWRLGLYPSSNRITTPVYSKTGELVNLRQYKYDAQRDKVINVKGGGIVLWPYEALEKETVYITEGEFKTILLHRHGFNAITGTAGAGTWKQEWNELFKDKHVIIILDVDDAGRKGAQKLCFSLFPFAKSIKNILLSDVMHIPKGDITDYFVKLAKTPNDLYKLINETPIYEPPRISSTSVDLELNDPIPVRLSKSSEAVYNNQVIETIGVVSAKDTAPYIIPQKCTVVCDKSRDYCRLCHVFLKKEAHVFEVPEHSPSILELINVGEKAQNEILKKHSKIYPGCKAAIFRRETSHNVEEMRLVPQIAIGHTSEEQVTRKAYYVGHGLASNHTYKMEARVCAEPKDGHATLLAFKTESMMDDLDRFKTTLDLSIFKPKEWTKDSVKQRLDHIYEDLENNVTKIYRRRDLHLFYDIAWHSVLYVPFQGRNVKGWADVLVIGDSGQGKSECSSRLSAHYKCGERVDTKRASVAGIVGGLQETAKRWFITWGTIPLNDRRLVILEEIKGMGATELAKMTDMRSSGTAEIIKIERAKTMARTRLIWISNPRSDSNLSAYNYGVDAVKELIGALEDIRRFDMVMAVATGEVPTSVINSVHSDVVQHTYTSELCSQLIGWAWSRKENNIRFDCEQEILEAAQRMGDTYSSSCPIVEPSDQRLKLARLAAGLAARTYSTDDGETLVVRKCHIEVVEEFLTRIYDSKALGYKDYSTSQKGEQDLTDLEGVTQILMGMPNAKESVKGMIEADLIKTEDIMNLTDQDIETCGKFLGQLIRKGCIRRHRRGGYRKTSAFIDLLKALDRAGKLPSLTFNEIISRKSEF